MTTKGKNILVPVNFEEQSEYALNFAIRLSKNIELPIILLYVYEEKNMFSKLIDTTQEKLFQKMIEEKLNEMTDDISKRHGIGVSSKIIRGSVHTEIVDYAEENKSELIIIGQGSNFVGKDKKSVILGSNASRVIRYSEVPVITIEKAVESTRIKHIMLPLDLTKETRQKVTWGIKIAKLFNAKITVVSALWNKHNDYVVNKLNHQMDQVVNFIKDEGIDCKGEIIKSDEEHKTLVPILLNYEEVNNDIDFVILMTQQEKVITKFFMGSLATEYIRNSSLPIMTINPEQLENYYIA